MHKLTGDKTSKTADGFFQRSWTVTGGHGSFLIVEQISALAQIGNVFSLFARKIRLASLCVFVSKFKHATQLFFKFSTSKKCHISSVERTETLTWQPLHPVFLFSSVSASLQHVSQRQTIKIIIIIEPRIVEAEATFPLASHFVSSSLDNADLFSGINSTHSFENGKWPSFRFSLHFVRNAQKSFTIFHGRYRRSDLVAHVDKCISSYKRKKTGTIAAWTIVPSFR